jgi:hypothetical protein
LLLLSFSKFTLSLLVARLYARSGLTKLVMLVSQFTVRAQLLDFFFCAGFKQLVE